MKIKLLVIFKLLALSMFSFADSQDERYHLSAYQKNYLMPFNYVTGVNNDYWEEEGEIKNIEAKFQISMKYPVLIDISKYNADLYFTYTNKSSWQIYSDSKPFRELNHSPELMLDFKNDWKFANITNTNILVSLNHTSNGKSGDASRGWNRLITDVKFKSDNYDFNSKVWIPLTDDNSDPNKNNIRDYMGFTELSGNYYYKDITFSGMTRYNIFKNKGAIELGFAYPITRTFSLYVEGFHGYGDTLIDFDHKTNRISIGILFSE